MSELGRTAAIVRAIIERTKEVEALKSGSIKVYVSEGNITIAIERMFPRRKFSAILDNISESVLIK